MDTKRFKEIVYNLEDYECKIIDRHGRDKPSDLPSEDALEALLGEECTITIDGEQFEYYDQERSDEYYYWYAKHTESGNIFRWEGWYDSHAGMERDSDNDFEQVILRERVEQFYSNDLTSPIKTYVEK
jgi:hypothetical protein